RVRAGFFDGVSVRYEPTEADHAKVRDALLLVGRMMFAAGAKEIYPGLACMPEIVTSEEAYVRAMPERLRRRFQSDGEVVLDFTVNADGTVSDIAVRSASDKALESVAVDAVRQWRYRPISTAQAHGVHLVFKLRP
ncbi:MAG TPA: TonB family protein, partial [Burkholderiaceae bacterium]|nr:TonB family protein [Burkholderiaceae bacterium]